MSCRWNPDTYLALKRGVEEAKKADNDAFDAMTAEENKGRKLVLTQIWMKTNAVLTERMEAFTVYKGE